MAVFLIIDVVLLALPLVYFRMVKKLPGPRLWLVLLLNLLVWFPLDYLSNRLTVRSYPADSALGIEVFALPLEELFLLITLPLNGLCLSSILRDRPFANKLHHWRKPIAWILIGLTALVYGLNYDKIYTAFVSGALCFALLVMLISGKSNFFGPLMNAWLILALPSALILGFLHGSGCVVVNPQEITGPLLGIFPWEELIGLLLIMLIPFAGTPKFKNLSTFEAS